MAARKTTTTGGQTTRGKARQRDRNSVAAEVLGTEFDVTTGTTGLSKLVQKMQRKEWKDVEASAVHGCDVACQVTDVRMLANRHFSMVVTVPPAYAQEIVQLGLDSARMFTMLRAYHVPRGEFIPAAED